MLFQAAVFALDGNNKFSDWYRVCEQSILCG